MRYRAEASQPLFEFILTDAADMHAHSGALQAILNKQLDGIIVRKVLAPQTITSVIAGLEADAEGRRKFPMFKDSVNAPYTLGRPIVGAETDLVDYYRDAQLQRARLNRLFEGHRPYEESIAEVFPALSGGLPVEAAQSPDGEAFTPSTVRVLPEGHEIGVHFGDQAAAV